MVQYARESLLPLAACVYFLVALNASTGPARGADNTFDLTESVGNSGSEGFLSDTWRDGLAVTGGIGVIITVLGFVFAMYQVSRATSVAEASSATAVKALNESRGKFKQYVVSHASRLVSEARTYVKSEDWQSVSLRLIDLTDMVAQIPDEDDQWEEFTNRLRRMESSFERVRDGEISFSPSLKSKWRKLAQDISSKISESGVPFPIAEKEVKS